MGGKSKNKGKVLRKSLHENNNNYLINPTKFNQIYNMLNETIDSDIDKHLNEFIGKYIREDDLVALNEKSKSKAQQKFMGMVRGVQKGTISPDKVSSDIVKTANSMKSKDVKDFASTKHDKLPEKVNEDHLHERSDKIKFICKAFMIVAKDNKGIAEKTLSDFLNKKNDKEINEYYFRMEDKLRRIGVDPKSININDMNEDTLTKNKKEYNQNSYMDKIKRVNTGELSDVNNLAKNSKITNSELHLDHGNGK
jgi:hypothetical protein